jgi:hypothetical protein
VPSSTDLAVGNALGHGVAVIVSFITSPVYHLLRRPTKEKQNKIDVRENAAKNKKIWENLILDFVERVPAPRSPGRGHSLRVSSFFDARL